MPAKAQYTPPLRRSIVTAQRYFLQEEVVQAFLLLFVYFTRRIVFSKPLRSVAEPYLLRWKDSSISWRKRESSTSTIYKLLLEKKNKKRYFITSDENFNDIQVTTTNCGDFSRSFLHNLKDLS